MTELVTFADVDAFTDEEILDHMEKYGYGTEVRGNSLRISFMYTLAELELLKGEDASLVVSSMFKTIYTAKVLPDPPKRGVYTRAEWIYILCGRCPSSLLSSLRHRRKEVTYDDLYAFYEGVGKDKRHYYFASLYGHLRDEYVFDGVTTKVLREDDEGDTHNIEKVIVGDIKYRTSKEILLDEARMADKASKIYPFVQEIVFFVEQLETVVISLPLGCVTVKEAINSSKESPIDTHTKYYEKAKKINGMLVANRIHHYGLVPERTYVDPYGNLWLTEFNAAFETEIPELRNTFKDSWSLESISS